ncbi:sigma-E processing peptidase SpoIIGA [Ruminococcus sp.]|uniref:sigma-E processing peptidase SpoIIGA n=1 Tax=Ruminococcus sp. TaxID=41978 RepID=UPI003EFFBE76
MRTVYIDVLITVNIFIDFFIILCTKKFLHLGTSYRRMILGSLLGGLFSLAALLPELPIGINILFDIASAAAIVFSVFSKCRLKSYIKRVAVYFFISFSFCGIMIFIYTSFKPKGMEIYNDTVYFNISPVVLIILTLACYYILKLIKRLTKGVCGGGICNVEINLSEKTALFSAKIDSGCNVKEPFSGDYVIIAEEDLLDRCIPDGENIRIIPFNSLGGEGILKGFKPDKIKINGIEINDVYIGICKNVIKGDIRALIPYEISKNID